METTEAARACRATLRANSRRRARMSLSRVTSRESTVHCKRELAAAASPLRGWAGMSRRLSVLVLTAASACAPEPASSVELRQTIADVVDLGRALAIEQTVVELGTDLDPGLTPAQLAMEVLAALAKSTPCASLERFGASGIHVEFGAPDSACSEAEPRLAGALRIVFSAPDPDERLATLTHIDLERAGATLTGTTQVTWGMQDARRVVSELRLEDADARQLEIQADRIQREYEGALQLDGFQQWQTLMGRWELEIGGWELERGALVPRTGVASIDTPYEHDIFLDFTGAVPEGLEVRANGGRRDHVFAVDPLGKVVDLGEG